MTRHLETGAAARRQTRTLPGDLGRRDPVHRSTPTSIPASPLCCPMSVRRHPMSTMPSPRSSPTCAPWRRRRARPDDPIDLVRADADKTAASPTPRSPPLPIRSRPGTGPRWHTAAAIRAYHERQPPRDEQWTDETGRDAGPRWGPVDAAGLYVRRAGDVSVVGADECDPARSPV